MQPVPVPPNCSDVLAAVVSVSETDRLVLVTPAAGPFEALIAPYHDMYDPALCPPALRADTAREEAAQHPLLRFYNSTGTPEGAAAARRLALTVLRGDAAGSVGV